MLKLPKRDLVVIGHTAIDTNTSAYGTQEVPGGAAFLVAAAASTISKHVSLISRIGPDYPIAELLKWEGLDTHHVKTVPGKTMRCTHRYLITDPSEREWEGFFNVGAEVCAADIPPHLLDTHFFHVATMPPLQQLPIIKHIRTLNPNTTISVDTWEPFIEDFHDEILEVMDAADLVFLDQNEATLMGIRNGKDMIITQGKKGAKAILNGNTYEVPTNPIETVKDKTGAGDVFAGIFLALRAKDTPIIDSLNQAVKTATQSVTEFGIDHIKS